MYARQSGVKEKLVCLKIHSSKVIIMKKIIAPQQGYCAVQWNGGIVLRKPAGCAGGVWWFQTNDSELTYLILKLYKKQRVVSGWSGWLCWPCSTVTGRKWTQKNITQKYLVEGKARGWAAKWAKDGEIKSGSLRWLRQRGWRSSFFLPMQPLSYHNSTYCWWIHWRCFFQSKFQRFFWYFVSLYALFWQCRVPSKLTQTLLPRRLVYYNLMAEAKHTEQKEMKILQRIIITDEAPQV